MNYTLLIMIHPTPYPEINALVSELLDGVQSILGSHFVGMYLDGSLANGDFDSASDIDFVIVTDEEVSGEQFEALRAMHDRLAGFDPIWGIQLEGSYLSLQAVRRHDPALTMHPNIERGQGERLKMAEHGADWNVHRWVLRDKGIVLAGPDPRMLVDPVSPDDLRQSMSAALDGWAAGLLANPALITHRGYQSYIVLSLCRILYTLHHGAVVSKLTAAHWALGELDSRWHYLIERSLEDRLLGGGPLDPAAVALTLDFIRDVIGKKRNSPQINTDTKDEGDKIYK